jgi:hypothetical protein
MGYRPGYRECDGRKLAPDAMPLDYMLAVMRDAKVSDARRERMATLAAPYCHEKVAYRPLGKRDQKAKQVRDKIEALELRTVEAETKAAEFRYRGVWQPGEHYRKNNFVTYDASVWACLRDTEGKPGQSLDWQLAVRKGKDGKDARAV